MEKSNQSSATTTPADQRAHCSVSAAALILGILSHRIQDIGLRLTWDLSLMMTSLEAIGEALGRMPSGIFILTTGLGGHWTGMLASWVQQAGFEPPMITVAVRKDRYVADWIIQSGRFTLNQVAAGQKSLLKHFGRGFEPGDDAFQGIPLRESTDYGPVLRETLGCVAAEVAGHCDGGDHRIFLGRLVAGQRWDHEADPMIHLRKSGLHY